MTQQIIAAINLKMYAWKIFGNEEWQTLLEPIHDLLPTPMCGFFPTPGNSLCLQFNLILTLLEIASNPQVKGSVIQDCPPATSVANHKSKHHLWYYSITNVYRPEGLITVSHYPSLRPAESKLCCAEFPFSKKDSNWHFPSIFLCTLQTRDKEWEKRGQRRDVHSLPHLLLEPSRELKTPTFRSEAE